jgi:O-antigen ligase
MAYSTASQPFSLAVVLFLVTAAVAVVRPTLGVYALILLTVIGDSSSAPWYPFAKNLSSAESILFISNGIKVSPLEVCLCAVVVGWILQMLTRRDWRVQRGLFFRPLAVFTGFALVGLAWGLGRGGDKIVGLWEMRPLLYVPLLYVLVTNLFTRSEQYERLYWCVMVGVVINSFVSIQYLEGLSAAQRLDLPFVGDHDASVVMNTMLVLFLAAWIFGAKSPAKRFLLPVMLIPVAFTYITAQRRAAVVGLIGAFFLMGVVLFWRKRRAFWCVVPVTTLLIAGYVGAFWNGSGSGVAFPALAVKSVVAPNQVDEVDKTSSDYRVLETKDAVYTIKSNPLLGVGFGQKFLRPYTLPAISQFIFAEYITHNSILWIWMKMGIGGFLAMLYVFSFTLRVGARTLRNEIDPDRLCITLTSVAFIVMYAIFTYVDISWGPKSMLLLAVAFGQIDFAHSAGAAAPSAQAESRRTTGGRLPVAVSSPG